MATRAARLPVLPGAGRLRCLLSWGAVMRRAMLTIARYRRTRFWGLYESDDLLCVTVYRKGAEAVRERLERGKAPAGRTHGRLG